MAQDEAATAKTPRALSLSQAWEAVAAHRLWGLAPFAFVLLGLSVSMGPFRLGLAALWLPAAAWLAAAHGAAGTAFAALAALPLLVSVGAQGIGTAGEIGLYLAALLIARLCGDADYRADCLAARRVGPWSLAFLFVVLASDADWQLRLGGVEIGFWTALYAYFFVVLVVVGLSAAPLGPILACLLVACLAGLGLQLIGARLSVDAGSIGYRLLIPRDLIAGAVALWIGRLVRPILLTPAGERAPPSFAATRPVLAALALVLLAGGLTLKLPALSGNNEVWLRFGSAAATAGLLFAAGALGGARGALAGILLWVLIAVAPAVAIVAFDFFEGGWLPVGGRLTLGSPPSLVGTYWIVAPGWQVAPFDLLFAVFGWGAWRVLFGRAATRRPLDDTPPPLRFQAADRILVVVVGLVLAAGIAAALWPG